jgi:hypothetical protein
LRRRAHCEDGERIVVGVDIGGERADSAVVWLNEQLQLGCQVLSGDRAVLEIAEVIRELAERFVIVECAFDPWRAGQIGQELEQRGIRVVHPDQVELNAHVAATVGAAVTGASSGARGVDAGKRSGRRSSPDTAASASIAGHPPPISTI